MYDPLGLYTDEEKKQDNVSKSTIYDPLGLFTEEEKAIEPVVNNAAMQYGRGRTPTPEGILKAHEERGPFELPEEMPSPKDFTGLDYAKAGRQAYQAVGRGAANIETALASQFENAPKMPPPYMTPAMLEDWKKRSPKEYEGVKKGERVGPNIFSEKLYEAAKVYPDIEEYSVMQ